MTKYELTFLLEKEDEAKNIQTLITSLSGKVAQENNWGRKELAYHIKKQNNALFYNWIIEMPLDKLSDLKKKLNFNEKILRYLLLKID